MSVELKGKFVEKAAGFVESFFPKYYGVIAAGRFKEKPFKYNTLIIYGDDIKGVMSFYVSNFNKNKAIITLLAGDKSSMETLLKSINAAESINIKVPKEMNSYIGLLKSLGFLEKNEEYSRFLNEEIVNLSKDISKQLIF